MAGKDGSVTGRSLGRRGSPEGGSYGSGSLDMGTPLLQAGDCPMQPAQYRFYRTQLTGLDVPLRNITQNEALIMRQYLGDHHHDDHGQSDEREQVRQHGRLHASRHGELETPSWSSNASSQFVASDPYTMQVRSHQSHDRHDLP